MYISMKKCTKCGENKSLDNFSQNKKGIFASRCHKCRSEDNKKYPSYTDQFTAQGKLQRSKREKERAKKIREVYGLGMRTIKTFGLRLALDVYDGADRKCSECGSNYDLTIHHKDGMGRHNKERGLPINNSINNLSVLCRKCHGSIHGKQGAKIKRKRRTRCISL